MFVMKKWMVVFVFCLSSVAGFAQKPFNVMTFNIRLNAASDSLNAWPYRKELVASQILFHETHILGVQEALHEQMEDLKVRLPGFKSHGVGRSDGKTGSEYSAIFYDVSRFKLLAGSTFWLSETPTVAGSKSWDAAITRIVTWARFKDLKTRKELVVFNTHFDHVGKEARRNSAKMLLKAVDSLAAGKPALIMGDFNAKPSDEPIQILVDAQNPLKLIDTKALSKTGHYGPGGTFTAFGPKEIDDTPIDHIFIRGNFEVLKHATLSQTWKGRFSSDHFPVFAQISIL